MEEQKKNESKAMEIGKKVGAWVKRNGKKILVGTGCFVLGVLAGASAMKAKDSPDEIDGNENNVLPEAENCSFDEIDENFDEIEEQEEEELE